MSPASNSIFCEHTIASYTNLSDAGVFADLSTSDTADSPLTDLEDLEYDAELCKGIHHKHNTFSSIALQPSSPSETERSDLIEYLMAKEEEVKGREDIEQVTCSQDTQSTEIVEESACHCESDDEVEELYRITKPSYSSLNYGCDPLHDYSIPSCQQCGPLVASLLPQSVSDTWTVPIVKEEEVTDSDTTPYNTSYQGSPNSYAYRLPSWAALPIVKPDPFIPVLPHTALRPAYSWGHMRANEGIRREDSLRGLLGQFSFYHPSDKTVFDQAMDDDLLFEKRALSIPFSSTESGEEEAEEQELQHVYEDEHEEEAEDGRRRYASSPELEILNQPLLHYPKLMAFLRSPFDAIPGTDAGAGADLEAEAEAEFKSEDAGHTGWESLSTDQESA